MPEKGRPETKGGSVGHTRSDSVSPARRLTEKVESVTNLERAKSVEDKIREIEKSIEKLIERLDKLEQESSSNRRSRTLRK